MKPRIYLLNGKKEEVSIKIIQEFEKNNWQFLIVDILAEFETLDLKEEEKTRTDLPEKLGLDILIKETYKILGLVTFFTTGPDETRAWTIEDGQNASQAGGVIHSDFESHFIKADIIGWKDLIDANGFVEARKKGLIRVEGKEYVVLDGDVVEIKHNA